MYTHKTSDAGLKNALAPSNMSEKNLAKSEQSTDLVIRSRFEPGSRYLFFSEVANFRPKDLAHPTQLFGQSNPLIRSMQSKDLAHISN